MKNTYGQAINPFLGEWIAMNQVIFVNLRNRDNVLSNIKLAMLKEIIGLGPQYYCVICSYNPDFESAGNLLLTNDKRLYKPQSGCVRFQVFFRDIFGVHKVWSLIIVFNITSNFRIQAVITTL